MKKLPYLNLGCGLRFHSGWTNVDFTPASGEVISHDLNQALPFETNTFEVVYSSHVHEHFSKEDGRRFLAECLRVLRPAGTLRVVVPDLEILARNYLKELAQAVEQPSDATAASRYEWARLHLIDQMVRTRPGGAMVEYLQGNEQIDRDYLMDVAGVEIVGYANDGGHKSAAATHGARRSSRWRRRAAKVARSVRALARGPNNSAEISREARFRASGEVHRWMYDRYSLAAMLREVGMSDIRQCRADESRVNGWSAFHLDTEPDGRVYKPESLFMEGTKPSQPDTARMR